LIFWLAPHADLPKTLPMRSAPEHPKKDETTVRDIYVFDFDGTITTRDTFALFLRYYSGTWKWALNILKLLPTFIGYKLGRIDRHGVKIAVINRFFAGQSATDIDSRAEQFAAEVIPPLVRPKARERLEELLGSPECGPESLYICSASIGPYLRWWASSCGVHEQNVMCTELAINADTIAEGLSGYNVWGSNKVRRIFDQFAPQSVKITEAYGDTRGDREMLHAAEASYFKPFRVTPISD
jgi:phosphatidylglycerophosphatase C